MKKKPTRVATPAIWRVKRGDPPAPLGAYYVTIKGVRINLATQDPDAARERRRDAMGGRRKFTPDASMRKPRAARAANDSGSTDGGAAQILAALDGGAPVRVGVAPGEAHNLDQPGSTPGPATGGGATGAPSTEDHRPESPTPPPTAQAAGWADDVAAAGANAAVATAAQQLPPPEPPPEISDAELAALGVKLQIWGAETWARQKIYKGFIAPVVPEEARAPLIEEWTKIIRYAGVSSVLPPWVTGLVIPAVTLITVTVAMAQGFAAAAAEQAKAAGVTPGPQPEPGA